MATGRPVFLFLLRSVSRLLRFVAFLRLLLTLLVLLNAKPQEWGNDVIHALFVSKGIAFAEESQKLLHGPLMLLPDEASSLRVCLNHILVGQVKLYVPDLFTQRQALIESSYLLMGQVLVRPLACGTRVTIPW